MKEKIFLTICVLFSLNAKSQKLKLSNFKFNDNDYSALIVNRKPDYGWGGKDGCIIECQTSLNLSSSQDSLIKGIVTNSENDQPIIGGSIQIWFKNQKSFLTITTDRNGTFQFSQQEKIIKIEVKSIGCRTLQIDLTKQHIMK
jgi:hypothetical protein